MFGTDFADSIVLAFFGLLIQTEIRKAVSCAIQIVCLTLKPIEYDEKRKNSLHPQHCERVWYGHPRLECHWWPFCYHLVQVGNILHGLQANWR